MKKAKVFFHPIEGTGALSISWSSGPKGDAIEAKKGAGVGFFSESGDLLSVIFDEVKADEDHQTLEFPRTRIEITIKKGRVTYSIIQPKRAPRIRKRRVNKKEPIKRL